MPIRGANVMTPDQQNLTEKQLTALGVLALLGAGVAPTGDLGIAGVSDQMLRTLQKAGLAECQRIGRNNHYGISPRGRAALQEYWPA